MTSGLTETWNRLRVEDPWSARAWVALVVTVAFTVVERFLFVFHFSPPSRAVSSDMAGYVDRAWRLASGAQLNRFDTFFPPGTHLLMTPAMWIAGDKDRGLILNQYLWWFLAVGTALVVAELAWQLFHHPVPVVLSLWGLYAHQAFQQYAGFFLSELPFSFFMACTVVAGMVAARQPPSRSRVLWYALTGVLGGVAMVIRPQFVLTAGVMGLPLLMRQFPFVRWREACALVGALVVSPLLAMTLNARAAGEYVGLATNGGFNFYQGHCPVDVVETRTSHGVYIWGSPARLQRLQREGRLETRTVIQGHMAWENDYFIREGLECIRRDGWGHLDRVVGNVADFFHTTSPWPGSASHVGPLLLMVNQIYCFALLCSVIAALFVVRRRKPERLLLMLLCTALPVALIFYGDSRFRIPYDMFGVVLTSGLLALRFGFRRDDVGAASEQGDQSALPTS
ncbi:MAG: hypothetical protein AB2A00_36740 [Myxococcota bacterium]